jgi:hypothetical protein
VPTGTEIAYNQITAAVNIASTNGAAPTTIIAGSSQTYDGQAVIAHLYSPDVNLSTVAGNQLQFGISESGAYLGNAIARAVNATQRRISLSFFYEFTPSAGAHTYAFSAHCASLTGTPAIGAGAAGGANLVPAFIRIVKV